MGSFKEVHLYETYHATGHTNTINKKTDPGLYATIQSLKTKDPYIKALMVLTELWNNNMMLDCYTTCNGMLPEGITPELMFAEIEMKDNPRIVINGYIADNKLIEKFYRNWKAYRSIKGHQDFQFVMADMCAVVAFFNNNFDRFRVRSKIGLDKYGYTQFAPDNASNLWYYSAIPRKELLDEMVKQLS